MKNFCFSYYLLSKFVDNSIKNVTDIYIYKMHFPIFNAFRNYDMNPFSDIDIQLLLM